MNTDCNHASHNQSQGIVFLDRGILIKVDVLFIFAIIYSVFPLARFEHITESHHSFVIISIRFLLPCRHSDGRER